MSKLTGLGLISVSLQTFLTDKSTQWAAYEPNKCSNTKASATRNSVEEKGRVIQQEVGSGDESTLKTQLFLKMAALTTFRQWKPLNLIKVILTLI